MAGFEPAPSQLLYDTLPLSYIGIILVSRCKITASLVSGIPKSVRDGHFND